MGFFLLCRPRNVKDICRILKDENIVDLHAKNGGEDHEIINRGHSGALLPLIDGLGRGKTEGILQIFDGVSRFNPQRRNILPGFGHINDGNSVHFLVLSGSQPENPAQLALKL